MLQASSQSKEGGRERGRTEEAGKGAGHGGGGKTLVLRASSQGAAGRRWLHVREAVFQKEGRTSVCKNNEGGGAGGALCPWPLVALRRVHFYDAKNKTDIFTSWALENLF